MHKSKTFFDSDLIDIILYQLWRRYKSKKLHDVMLIAGSEGERIPAHRNILSESSEYFNAMFTSSMRERISKEVKMHKRCVVISEDILLEIFKSHEKFLVKHAIKCIGYAPSVKQYNCELFLQYAGNFCLENFKHLRESDEFLSLNAKQLLSKLLAFDFCVETIINILMAWIDRKRIGGIKLIKPKRSYQYMMGIAQNQASNRMFLHYYCPKRQQWMQWLQELEIRFGFAVALMEDDLFIIGGKDERDEVLNTVICLNLKCMSLKQMTAMQEHRAFCAAAVLNGFLYALGGWNGRCEMNSVERWDPKTNKWDVVASMTLKRDSFGIAVLNEKLYVIGGGYSSQILSSAECYDPIKNVWQSISSMGENRQLHGVAVANGLLYAVGGHQRDTVERYDPETNEWTRLCSLGEEFFLLYPCFTLRDRVVACYNDHIDEYNAVTNEWKEVASFEQLENSCHIFSYSDKLLTSEFVEI